MIPRQTKNRCPNYKNCKITDTISGENSIGNLILGSIRNMEAAKSRSLDILKTSSLEDNPVVQDATARLDCSAQSLVRRNAYGKKTVNVEPYRDELGALTELVMSLLLCRIRNLQIEKSQDPADMVKRRERIIAKVNRILDEKN